MSGWVIVSLILGVIWGIVVDKVIESKGYKEEGWSWFWWGFFFGIFALIVALAKPVNITTTYEQRTAFDVWSDKRMVDNGGWKCNKCGKTLPSYTGTCSCGNTKEFNSLLTKTASQDNAVFVSNAEELKKYKDLLDSGVITQEEFEAKKKQLLKL